MKRTAALLWIVLALPAAVRAAGDPDVRAIAEKIDALYRAESSYSVVEMEIVTPHWERTLAMEIWTRGLEETFIRINSPRKEKGVATLRIGNEMWNYLPKTNKVIKVPPSMMMSSWMGSDFTNDDIVEEFTLVDDYTYSFTTMADPLEDVLYIKAVPREGLPVVWGYTIIGVRESDHIPVWEGYYDERDTLMRTLHFRDIRDVDGRPVPMEMEMIPAHKQGHRTVVRYVKLEFDAPVDGDIFSLRNLRAR